MRVDGPLTIVELRRRAKTGALSKLALVSTDKKKWTVASKVALVFLADGTVNTAPVVEDVEEEVGVDVGADGAYGHFAVPLPRVGAVRVEWILVPAWCVAMIAGLLPVARAPGHPVFAWEFPALAAADGWRGVVAGCAWVAVVLTVLVQLFYVWKRPGIQRASAGVAGSAVVVALTMVAFGAGASRGVLSAIELPIGLFGLACVHSTTGKAPSSRRADGSLIDSSLATTFAVVGVISVITMFVAVAVKGLDFLVAGIFVVIAGASGAIAGIVAGGEDAKRNAVAWLGGIALTFSVLAVLAEGITATLVGAPRMATFDAVRALAVTAMAALCAYLSIQERSAAITRNQTTADESNGNQEQTNGDTTNPDQA